MANELKINGQAAGLSLYAIVERADGQIWNTALTNGAGGFEAPLSANWAAYTIPLTETTLPGRYRGAVPTGIATAGKYNVALCRRVGAAPAITDPPVGSGDVEWTGAADLTNTTTQTRVLAALPSAPPGLTGGLPTVNSNNQVAGVASPVVTDVDATVASILAQVGNSPSAAAIAAAVWAATARTLTATGATGPTAPQIAAAVWQDVTAANPDFTTGGDIGALLVAMATVIGKLTVNIDGSVNLNMAQPIPSVSAPTKTTARALQGAIAGAFGQEAKVGTGVTVKDEEGTNTWRTFTLDNGSNPTARI